MTAQPPSPDESMPPPEELLGLGEPRYSALDVSAKTGLDVEEAKRLWRAMGFVVVPEEDIYFTQGDVDVLTRLVDFMEQGFADIDVVLGTTRTMSQSVARIAEAEADAIRDQLFSYPPLAERLVATEGASAKEAFAALEEFLVYVWRRRLADALNRGDVLALSGPSVDLTVGFADLVGFTRLSREITESELSELIERFEAMAQEATTEFGGRIVKTIGDEVMFVADDCHVAADVALRLMEHSETDEQIDIRIGLAMGELTAHHGDYFGNTVNLASRAARAARPGTALVSEEIAEALDERPGYDTKPIPKRKLKGIGSSQLYVLRRTEP